MISGMEKPAKWTIVLAFSLGVLVGAIGMFGFKFVHERREKNQIDQNWRQRSPNGLQAYYRSSVKVPLPKNLDLSTNTWRQLVFWEAYARLYTLAGTNNISRPFALRSYGFSKKDPYWFSYLDVGGGSELAYGALSQRASGLSDEQISQWVSTNRDWLTKSDYYTNFLELIRKDPSGGK